MIRRWAMIMVDRDASQTVKFAVMSLLMRAEAQNQKDEEYQRKNKNRTAKQLVLHFEEDFYGNDAHEMAAAQAAAASSTDSGISGTQENRDLRPEVGQDALGNDRVSERSRSGTGPPARGG
jgi:citrate synthase